MKRRYWAFPASVGSEYLAPGLCWPCIGSVLVLFCLDLRIGAELLTRIDCGDDDVIIFSKDQLRPGT